MSARPPLSIDMSRLQAWLERAQPMARLVYHRGFFECSADEALKERLRAEAKRGMVYLFQDYRDADYRGHDYLAIRSSRPWSAAACGVVAIPSMLRAAA